LLAPYLSIGLFWLLLENGWLALLGYHAQILFWARGRRPGLPVPRGRALLTGLPSLVAGPALYFLLPHITRVDLGGWLDRFHVSGWALVLLIPYYGLVHPVLEQRHWGPLRNRTHLSHLFFAGYHALVLFSLVSVPWLLFGIALLLGASVAWQVLARRTGGMMVPAAIHIGSDLGLITAAWLRVAGG